MRLIDADELKTILSIRRTIETIQHAVDNAPTIDAVPRKDYEELERHFVNWEPVVRCKDCKWWTKQEKSIQGRCALTGTYPTGGWYCGNGERRDDEIDRR